jgi:hypothetical protein
LTCATPVADGCVASACSQGVSDSVFHAQHLLLMVVWHLPALRT